MTRLAWFYTHQPRLDCKDTVIYARPAITNDDVMYIQTSKFEIKSNWYFRTNFFNLSVYFDFLFYPSENNSGKASSFKTQKCCYLNSSEHSCLGGGGSGGGG